MVHVLCRVQERRWILPNAPLRINGSALESIFSSLTFRAGGSLSEANYSRIIKKELEYNASVENVTEE